MKKVMPLFLIGVVVSAILSTTSMAWCDDYEMTNEKLSELVANGTIRDHNGETPPENIGLCFESNINLSDITPLAELKGLIYLSLYDCPISDISPLMELTNLDWLNLDDTKVSDISPLRNLTNLSYLSFEGSKVSDLTPLYGLKNLKGVQLWNTPLSLTQINELQEALPNCIIYHNATEIGCDGCSRLSDYCICISSPLLSECYCNNNGSYDFDCTKGTVIIEDGTTNIASNAFEDCMNITSIKIIENLNFYGIGEEAFGGSSLNTITFPTGTHFGLNRYIFILCENLNSVIFKGSVPPDISYDTFDLVSSDFTIYVPLGSKSSYETAFDRRNKPYFNGELGGEGIGYWRLIKDWEERGLSFEERLYWCEYNIVEVEFCDVCDDFPCICTSSLNCPTCQDNGEHCVDCCILEHCEICNPPTTTPQKCNCPCCSDKTTPPTTLPPVEPFEAPTTTTPSEPITPSNVFVDALNQEKPFVKLDKNTGTVISKESLQAIKDSGKIIKIELPNGLIITIDPATITDNAVAIDLNIDVDITDKATNIDGTKIPANSVVIRPSAHGEFGFEINFTITAEQLSKSGLSVSNIELFYVDKNGNVTDYPNVTRNADGSVTISISKASYYYLSEKSQESNNATTTVATAANSNTVTNSNNADVNPSTGIVIGFTSLTIAGVTLLVSRKRRNK